MQNKTGFEFWTTMRLCQGNYNTETEERIKRL